MIKINDSVLDILSNSRIDGNLLFYLKLWRHNTMFWRTFFINTDLYLDGIGVEFSKKKWVYSKYSKSF